MARIILITLLAFAFAQADETISLRALAMDKGEIPQWHVAVGKDQFQPLAWLSTQPSPPVTAVAGADLLLYEKAAGNEDEPSNSVAKKVVIPDSAKELLLLASIGENGKIELFAIPDLYQQAKFNDWLVINLSEFETKLNFGKDNKPIELKSGESGIYKIEGEADKGGEAVAHANIKEEFRKIYSTFWSATAGQRSLVLIHDSDKRTKVRRILDFLPKREE